MSDTNNQDIDAILNKLNEGLELLAMKLGEHGDKAVDLMLLAVSVTGLQKIIWGIAPALILGFIVYFTYINLSHIKNDIEKNDGYVSSDNSFARGITYVLGIFGSVICLAFIMKTLFDLSHWIAVFLPKVWIAKQILSKIL